MARSSRLSVCMAIETRNSSNIHCMRSISRQRTTPWIAGIGPFSINLASADRCVSFNIGCWPGALPLMSWRFERRLSAGAQRSCSGGAGSGPFSRLARHRGGILRDATQTPPTHSAQAGAAATRSS